LLNTYDVKVMLYCTLELTMTHDYDVPCLVLEVGTERKHIQ